MILDVVVVPTIIIFVATAAAVNGPGRKQVVVLQGFSLVLQLLQCPVHFGLCAAVAAAGTLLTVIIIGIVTTIARVTITRTAVHF